MVPSEQELLMVELMPRSSRPHCGRWLAKVTQQSAISIQNSDISRVPDQARSKQIRTPWE